jgi:ferritin-like protein
MERLAHDSLTAARKIATRVADLDGSVQADPRQLVVRSPLADFQLPRSFGDIPHILGYALDQVDVAIREYEALIDRVRGKDDLTHRLAVELLADEIHRRADLRAILAHD